MKVLLVIVVLVVLFLAYKLYVAAGKLNTAEGKVSSLEQQKIKNENDLKASISEVNSLKIENDKWSVRCDKQAEVLSKAMVRNAKGRMQKFSEAYPTGG